MTLPESIASIGHVAANLQRSPEQIRLIASRLGITPAVLINEIAHYEESDLQQIAEAFRGSSR